MTDNRDDQQSATSSDDTPPNEDTPGTERIPLMQQLLDNPFLLLFLGVTIPTVFYLIWGIIEIAQIPLAR